MLALPEKATEMPVGKIVWPKVIGWAWREAGPRFLATEYCVNKCSCWYDKEPWQQDIRGKGRYGEYIFFSDTEEYGHTLDAMRYIIQTFNNIRDNNAAT